MDCVFCGFFLVWLKFNQTHWKFLFSSSVQSLKKLIKTNFPHQRKVLIYQRIPYANFLHNLHTKKLKLETNFLALLEGERNKTRSISICDLICSWLPVIIDDFLNADDWRIMGSVLYANLFSSLKPYVKVIREIYPFVLNFRGIFLPFNVWYGWMIFLVLGSEAIKLFRWLMDSCVLDVIEIVRNWIFDKFGWQIDLQRFSKDWKTQTCVLK